MPAPLSVLVPTLDEEVNLPECLASLAWADQVIVVDSFSHDRTIAIAREFGAHVVQHEFENYSRQKNWALETLPFRHEWVLIVDADERVTPELRAEIEAVLAAPEWAGYYVNRRFIFLGTWIRHAGWYPSWNLRLFRHRLAVRRSGGARARGARWARRVLAERSAAPRPARTRRLRRAPQSLFDVRGAGAFGRRVWRRAGHAIARFAARFTGPTQALST
jgi:glycosyltransferase involved in cell wall biosynthesis